MTKLVSFLCVAALAACGGGGGGSPKAACNDLYVALCAQLYSCYSDAERAAIGLPPTEAACITNGQNNAGCEAMTEDNACDGNEEYQSGKASECVDQVEGLECSQVRDPNFDFEVQAPACGEVCVVP